jgi:hypothetical protein
MVLSLLAKPNRSASLKAAEGIALVLIQFDASLTERYSRTKEVTAHPVESGADITDHTRTLPKEIEIHGWVSDDPIIFLKSLRATPSVLGGNPLTRAFDAWTELNRIMDEESTVKVVTELDEFDSMVLTNIDVTKDKDTGRILDATITLREIVIATTEVTEAPEPTQSNRKKKSGLGKQVGKPPSDTKGSLFTRIASGVGSQ